MAYTLGIYLLNLFLAFLQPKFDPSIEQDNEMEDGSVGGLPTKQDEEFRPFIRRLPEFKFWYSATRALLIGFICTWFEVFDIPVFWPVLVMYWLILFALTSMSSPPISSFCFPQCLYIWFVVIILFADKNVAKQTVRRQIQHMIKYRYVPFTFGKARYNGAGK